MLPVVPLNVELSKVWILLIGGTNADNFAHDIAIFSVEFTAVSNLKDLIFVLELAIFLPFSHLVWFYELLFMALLLLLGHVLHEII